MCIHQRLILEMGNASNDFTIGENVATKYNFQNLSQTKEAFDYVLQKQTDHLTDYFSEEIFNSTVSEKFFILHEWIRNGDVKEQIEKTLEKAFRIRHRVTHDANYLVDFKSNEMNDIESVFQTIPQYFIAFFAKKYSQNRFVFHTEKNAIRITDTPQQCELTFIFSPEDLIADNYHIVPD